MSTDADSSANLGAMRKRRRALLIAAVIIALFAGGWYAWQHVFLANSVSTDDAYVHGNRVPVTPQEAGTIVAVFAQDTDYVKRGQLLVELDPADARIALDRAEADLAQAVRQVRKAQAQVDALQAKIAIARARLTLAQANYQRQQKLRARGVSSQEQFDQARTALEVARGTLALDQSELAAAKAALGSGPIGEHPAVRQAAAAVRTAYLNLQRTRIVAPVSGYVAERAAQPGQQVAPGSVLMYVVPLNDVWIDANFKETQLRRVRIGQPATVTADFYGGSVVYHGKVAGLSAGTGEAFALLPPQNATGNWIKVVQRLPVRIALPANELAKHPLRLGLSMNVTIHTGKTSGPVLAVRAHPSPEENAAALYARQLAGANALIERIIRANSPS